MDDSPPQEAWVSANYSTAALGPSLVFGARALGVIRLAAAAKNQKAQAVRRGRSINEPVPSRRYRCGYQKCQSTQVPAGVLLSPVKDGGGDGGGDEAWDVLTIDQREW